MKKGNLIIIIIYLTIIFRFSHMDSFNSSNYSKKVVNSFVELSLKVSSIDYDKEEIRDIVDFVNPFMRKFAHFFEYFVLSFILCGMISHFENRKSSILFIVIMLCLSCSSLDEYHQTFIRGRVGSIKDIIIDMSGCLFNLLLYVLYSDMFFTNLNRWAEKNNEQMQKYML